MNVRPSYLGWITIVIKRELAPSNTKSAVEVLADLTISIQLSISKQKLRLLRQGKGQWSKIKRKLK